MGEAIPFVGYYYYPHNDDVLNLLWDRRCPVHIVIDGSSLKWFSEITCNVVQEKIKRK